MHAELDRVLSELRRAALPEDVFGNLDGDEMAQRKQGKSIFRHLALIVHEDKHQKEGKEAAREAFRLLSSWWTHAQQKITARTYGNRTPAVTATIKTRHHTYETLTVFGHDDTCDLFLTTARAQHTTFPALLKIARDPRDNDLVKNEATILGLLRKDARGKSLHVCLPDPIESFNITEAGRVKTATTFRFRDGLTPLSAIMQAYPNGVDPRDAVWMWKRTLGVLGLAHALGIVHGAILPPHILIDLPNHGVYLDDWCYAVTTKAHNHIKAISLSYESYYPQEVLKKQQPSAATDLYMLAKSMSRLMGGADTNGTIPPRIPKPMRQLLQACLIEAQSQRLTDAWKLHRDIDEQLEQMFGPRRFRKFVLPPVPGSPA